VAESLMFEGGAFWQEIASVFHEGTEEGTGEHRLILWGAATRVWMESPIVGVGLGNWGVYASEFFQPGEIEGFDNLGAFYGLNTHNAYVQILAEVGVVGLGAFVWCIVDFFLKNRALARPEAIARWNATDAGRKLDLRYLKLALEGAMVATILVNMVYASLFEPWFVTIWAANRMLWALTSPEATSGKSAPARASRGGLRPPNVPR
jgi:O-antigen ligase